jgi:hypothetical protein
MKDEDGFMVRLKRPRRKIERYKRMMRCTDCGQREMRVGVGHCKICGGWMRCE